MIDKSNQNITLKVCLEDVGTHNKAVLDFFFAKLGQHTFSRVDTQEEANALIIDYDYPPARQRYEEEYQQWHKPTVVLSISPVELDGVIWLSKPLTSRALLDAAQELQTKLLSDTGSSANPEDNKELDSAQNQALHQQRKAEETAQREAILQRPEIKPLPTVTSNIPLVSEAPNPVDNADETPAIAEQAEQITEAIIVRPELSDEQLQARWQQLCGTYQDIDPKADFSQIQSEDGFFLSSLKDAVRLARQCQQGVLLNFPDTRIYVLPEIHRIFCAIPTDSAEFIDFINACSAAEGGKMHILSTKEIHELNDMIAAQTSALYDLESFVWSSSLLSAQGRLSRELNPSKPVGLKHWPSLTRLERFPHVMPVAALWSTDSLSAFDVARSLNIPQRYVFSFYNAASALGLIEQDSDKLIKKQSTPRTTEAPRGLFSRLLKRLIGG